MKKGFTLVEMLSVIVILGIITLIAFPAIDKNIKESREKAYAQSVQYIEQAAEKYSVINDLGYEEEYKTLDLQVLKNAGLLKDEDIQNPIDGSVMTGCIVYKWINSSNQYEFKYSAACEIPQ